MTIREPAKPLLADTGQIVDGILIKRQRDQPPDKVELSAGGWREHDEVGTGKVILRQRTFVVKAA